MPLCNCCLMTVFTMVPTGAGGRGRSRGDSRNGVADNGGGGDGAGYTMQQLGTSLCCGPRPDASAGFAVDAVATMLQNNGGSFGMAQLLAAEARSATNTRRRRMIIVSSTRTRIASLVKEADAGWSTQGGAPSGLRQPGAGWELSPHRAGRRPRRAGFRGRGGRGRR